MLQYPTYSTVYVVLVRERIKKLLRHLQSRPGLNGRLEIFSLSCGVCRRAAERRKKAMMEQGTDRMMDRMMDDVERLKSQFTIHNDGSWFHWVRKLTRDNHHDSPFGLLLP